MNCPQCQAPLSEGVKFCSQCGTPVANPCPACKAENPAEAKFCCQCGNSLKAPTKPLDTAASGGETGDRRIVTVLFTDVSGFTSMSEKLDPEEVTEIVNQFFSVLTEPIYKFGGVVDKYIGDAIMALFGAPIAHEDDAERAVWAAYEMQIAAKRFAEQLEVRTGITLKVRIGINTGLVVAGAVGGAHKQDYTVMGDTVNLAQRMEANAKPGKVLITRETFRLTYPRFDFESLDAITVKGKAQPIDVYQLIGPKDCEAKMREEAFVNRESELENLRLCWEQAAQGLPQLAIITGEAGIGKSRLVAQFISHCEPHPFALRAACQSYTQQVSFGLVTSLLRNLLGLPSATSPLELQKALLNYGRQLALPEPERFAHLLGIFLGIEPLGTEIASLSQEQRRNAAIEQLNVFLALMGQKQPILLSLEDLQWADEASLQWLMSLLEYLSNLNTPPAFLVVVQHRPNLAFSPDNMWRHNLTRIQVRALKEADALALLLALLRCPSDALSPQLAQLLRKILLRAEGNPFYLKELLLALQDGEILVKGNEGWEVRPGASGFKMPTTIQGAVASRLDRLPSAERSLLQVASVLGRNFAEPLLAQVSGTTCPVSGLAELIKGGFLSRNARGDLSFSQVLTQEVAYQSLLLSLRKKLHQRTGLAIETIYPAQLDESAQLLSYHYLAGEDFNKGLVYLFRSAQRSFALFDVPTAKTAVENALAIALQHPEIQSPTRWELRYLQGQILTSLSHFEPALEALEEAQALSESQPPATRAKIFLAKGDIYERQGNYPLARDTYQAGHDLLQASPIDQAPFLTKIGYAKFRMGQYEECLGLYQQALALMGDAEMPKEQGFAHSCIGNCLWRQGEIDKAIQHVLQSKQYREKAQDLVGSANSCTTLANIYSETGKAEQAEHYYRQALQAYERMGDAYLTSLCLSNLGSHLLTLGKLGEAEVFLRKALEIQQRHQTKQVLALILFNLGDALSYRQKWDEALAFVRKALDIFVELEAKEVLPEVYRSIGGIYAEMRRFDEAKSALSLAVEHSAEVGDPITPGVATRIQALIAHFEGDSDKARTLVHEAISVLQEQEAPLELGRAYALLARLGGHDAGQAQQQAQALFHQIGAQLDLANLQ